MGIYVQVFVWTPIFKSFEYLPRSGHTRTSCNFMFNILRNCKTVFQSECMILHSHHQYLMASTSPYPLQCLLLSLFYYQPSQWVRSDVLLLIFIFLMANDIEYFFHVLWTFIHILFKNTCLNLLPIFLLLTSKCSLCGLDTSSVARYMI